MSTTWTIERQVHFQPQGYGQGKQLRAGPAPEEPVLLAGRVPRVARLMALALRFDELVRTGAVKNYTELARLGHVTRARVTQVMNLLYRAPDLQEQLLFLPRTVRGRDAVILHDLLPIAAVLDWRQQRRLWAELLKNCMGKARNGQQS